jgi:hypothetical protein
MSGSTHVTNIMAHEARSIDRASDIRNLVRSTRSTTSIDFIGLGMHQAATRSSWPSQPPPRPSPSAHKFQNVIEITLTPIQLSNLARILTRKVTNPLQQVYRAYCRGYRLTTP